MTDWVSTKMARQMLGVSATTIKRWANERKMPSMRTAGGHRRFKRSDIQRILGGQVTMSDSPALKEHWLDWLAATANSTFIEARVKDLYSEFDSWFAVADFLASVFEKIDTRWTMGKCTILEEHVAPGRLDLALSAISSSFRVPEGAPICLLVTLPGEQYALGLSLAQMCLRSENIEAVCAGTNTPVDQIISRMPEWQPHSIGLFASSFSLGRDSLASAYKKVATTCKKLDVELLLVGRGAWPDSVDYGHRCRTFAELEELLPGMAAVSSRSASNHAQFSNT